MPTQKKIDSVTEIKEYLDAKSGFFVVNYRGISVKDIQILRHALREADAEMKVYKNNLISIAMADLELPEMNEYLAGPNGFVFFGEDAAAAAKVLKTFAATHEALELRCGLYEGEIVDEAAVKAIADLPSREELIAKLLGTIQNPLTKIVRVINGPAEAMARVVKAIADQKEAA